MYFTREAKASYYDCDCNNLLKISAAMRQMQQTSSEQLEQLGISVEKLYAEDMVFLLSKMCIKVHRMPACAERFVVGTAPLIPRGVRFIREFVIDSPSGERLISAFTLWILVHVSTRKILRPSSFPYAIPFQEASLGGIIDDVPFPKKAQGETAHLKMPINYSHIDVNHHVNNTVYADFVCDALPYEPLVSRGLDTLIIGYQNEARQGETVEISTTALSDTGYHVIGRHGGFPCFEALALLQGLPEEGV